MSVLSILGPVTHYASTTQLVVCMFFLGWVGNVLYNIYFHPLASIPGPLLWRASRLGFIRSLVTGNLVVDVKKLHDHYGKIVRIAPDEVSFAHEDAWQDVFSCRAGHKPFPRNPTFFKSPPGQPDNLITTVDPNENARMRQVAMPAFTERALAKQEPIIQSYTTLLIEKLLKQINASEGRGKGAIINVVDWFQWFTFDVVGELTLGESFNCLSKEANHPWLSLIFNNLKAMALAAATRYYTGLEQFLIFMLPASIRQMQVDHYATALDKIHRRMDRKTALDDFMTPMLDDNNPNFQKMTLAEVESTTALLLIAGSETTSTTLCGTINCLVQNPIELRRLEREVRGKFGQEDDITLRSLLNLPFLNAVINEGLRMCNPVAGGILRVAPKGGDIVCGHYLPEGTHVTVNSVAMAYSEDHFYRHKEFLPSRFLPNDLRPTEFEKDRPKVLKPFGVGARSCLGKSVAMSELRLVLARLVWNFDLDTAPGKQVKWSDLKTYVVVQKEPINITIKARS